MRRINKAKRSHLLAAVRGRLCPKCQGAPSDPDWGGTCLGCQRKRLGIPWGRHGKRMSRRAP